MQSSVPAPVASASTTSAASAPQDSLPTIVFTPGAWHGTWVFDAVRAKLESLGYPTEAVALPSVGNTDSSVGAAEDTAALAAVLATLTDAGKDVVMLCHSYGGVPASTAVAGYGHAKRSAAGLKGGVIMLVYMAAFAVPAGTSLIDALGGKPSPWITPDSTGNFVTPSDASTIFYADVTDQSVVAKAVAALQAEPARFISDNNLYEPWNNGVEVGYIFAEQDLAIPLAAQKNMAAQFPSGSFSYTLDSSHSPFLSMPEQLATVIVAAANAGLSKKVR